jgi:hypothetical protein
MLLAFRSLQVRQHSSGLFRRLLVPPLLAGEGELDKDMVVLLAAAGWSPLLSLDRGGLALFMLDAVGRGVTIVHCDMSHLVG